MRANGIEVARGDAFCRQLGDLADLTALSIAWAAADHREIAQSLAETLMKALDLDLIYIRLKGAGPDDAIEVIHSDEQFDNSRRYREIAGLLHSNPPFNSIELGALSLQHPFEDRHLQTASIRIGFGGELGALLAASERPGFPAREDRLILTVAANQAAAALQRCRAEESLRRSERELADFFENAPVGVHWVGPDGVVMRANQALLDMLGYRREEYVGHGAAEFHVDPDACEAILRHLQGGGELHGHPVILRCKDGSIRHALIDSNVCWEAGRFIHTRCVFRDVTDKKRADLLARFSDDAGGDYNIVVCFDGREFKIESAGEGFTSVTGYAADEFTPAMALLAIHPDDYLNISQKAELLLRGEMVDGDVRLITKSGDVRHLHYFAEPSFDASDPHAIRIRGTAKDITMRRQEGERGREMERQFRHLADHIAEVFWIADPARSQILYCSPAFASIWGRSIESLARDPTLWSESIVPEDRGRFIAALEETCRGQAAEVEYRIARPDGSIRWIRDRSFPISDSPGEVLRVAGLAEDMTERKRAEENRALFAAIVESSEDAIVSKTLDGIVTSWNAGAERLFEYSAAEAIGRPITMIIPDDRLQEEVTILSKLRRGERIEHFETVRRSKYGRLINISLTISPVRDNSGRIIGASKVARDITSRKIAESSLREAEQRKDEFLAMLAHELRNPLAPIRNAVHILHAKGSIAPELQWARDIIERQLQQLTRLVDDLLDVSRITRGKIGIHKQPVELSSVVNAAVEGSRPLLDRCRHELFVALPPDPIQVNVDPTRFTQVLLNLLNNAAKYTEPGGRIWLTVELLSADDGSTGPKTDNSPGPAADQAMSDSTFVIPESYIQELVIRVKDTGIGIPREMLPRVFEMFTQLEYSLERSQGGLGIGLALARRLIEMHGGTLTAHSGGPGQGSEFVVRLPVVLAADPSDAETTTVAAATKIRILVVDDNRDSVESLAMLLRLTGHEVHTAGDGAEAVRSAVALKPDLILLDIGLPKMNGYEAARRIREALGDGVMLIALTGWGQDEDRRRSKEAGFDHHLTKPLQFDALQQLLAEMNKVELNVTTPQH